MTCQKCLSNARTCCGCLAKHRGGNTGPDAELAEACGVAASSPSHLCRRGLQRPIRIEGLEVRLFFPCACQPVLSPLLVKLWCLMLDMCCGDDPAAASATVEDLMSMTTCRRNLRAVRCTHHAAIEVQAQADEVDFGDVRCLCSATSTLVMPSRLQVQSPYLLHLFVMNSIRNWALCAAAFTNSHEDFLACVSNCSSLPQ